MRGGHAVRGGVAAADHDHVLVARSQLRRRPCYGAIALDEVLHRGVDAGQVVAGQVDAALDPRARRQHDRVVLRLQVVGGDLDAVAELDPGLLEQRTRRSMIHFSSLKSGTPSRINPPGPSSRS